MVRIWVPSLLAGMLIATAVAADEPLAPPDVAPLAALVSRPTGDCNAADFFLKAEEILRPELGRTEIALSRDHPAALAALQGLACRRCEFPYSRRLTLPPTEQPIPMGRLYLGLAAMLSGEGAQLLAAGKPTEAQRTFGQAVQLGLLLQEEPGITIVQEIMALSVLARGAEGLGDLAVARGDDATAATCARFLAGRQSYVDGATRFVRDLGYSELIRQPSAQAEKVKSIASAYATMKAPALRAEMLLYLCLSWRLVDEPSAASAARGILESARRDEDPRIRALAEWGLALTQDAAREQVRIMASSPWPGSVYTTKDQ
jgi:hypothetical protein